MDGAGRLLRDAFRRASRSPAGRMLVVLHLSRLRSPAPRPYHRRIAMAVLQDTAQRYDGQLFPLPNGDLVMLCRGAGTRRATTVQAAEWVVEPSRLPDLLGRLFRVDMQDASRMTSLWALDAAIGPASAYVDDQARIEAPERDQAAMAAQWSHLHGPGGQDEGQTMAVDALAGLAGGEDLAWAMQRQTAILVGAGTGFRPIFREVTFSIAELEARLSAGAGEDAAGRATRDPFLFRHLAARLDPHMLEAVGGAARTTLSLDPCGVLPLHLNLTVGGVLSDPFRRFAAASRSGRADNTGVEIPMLEACLDAATFAEARRVVAGEGMAFVLDGVSHHALMLTCPAALEPDLLKLDWSPRMAELAGDDRVALAEGVAAIGADRIVLHRAETEAALHWGLAHGIRRFQGRHVDAMLGAARITGCEMSAGCTLGQCIEREAAVARLRRMGCGNPGLLDAAMARRAEAVPA